MGPAAMRHVLQAPGVRGCCKSGGTQASSTGASQTVQPKMWFPCGHCRSLAHPLEHPHVLPASAACAGFNWKGHASDIAELLQQVVSCSEDPPGVLAGLVAGPLAAVPGKVAAKQQLEPVAGWAALCSSTFLVWYRWVWTANALLFDHGCGISCLVRAQPLVHSAALM
jgi:hypothetical protein